VIIKRQTEPNRSGEGLPRDSSRASDEFVALAAKRAGVESSVAESVLTAFFEALEERLLEGDRVALGDLLDLGVVREPARIRRDPSGRFSEIAPARNRLDVRCGSILDERLASLRGAGILLVMPNENRFAEMLGEHFAKLGWMVQRAVDSESAISLLGGATPYLLVCDHALADRDLLVHRIKADWRSNAVPVVTLHTRFEDLERPEGLLVRGDMAVFEPIAVSPFLRAMDQLLAQATEEAAVFERQLRFRVPVRERAITGAFELGDSFFRDAGFRGDSLVALTTAYREAIRNAEIHGSAGDDSLAIDIEILLDRAHITVSVEDEGEGFDHRAYFVQLDGTEPVSLARERHANGGVGGLGIYLMARCVDRVEYSDRGNRITLVKARSIEPAADEMFGGGT
jgi:anti-sigma regulatory factor (Ser/Thr protein kinase)/nucleoid DNA-binding protein